MLLGMLMHSSLGSDHCPHPLSWILIHCDTEMNHLHPHRLYPHLECNRSEIILLNVISEYKINIHYFFTVVPSSLNHFYIHTSYPRSRLLFWTWILTLYFNFGPTPDSNPLSWPVVPNLFWLIEHLSPGKVLAEHFRPKKTLTEHLNPKILHFCMNFKVSKNLVEHLGPACGTVVGNHLSWPYKQTS